MQAWLCAHLITTLTIISFFFGLALGNHKGERHEGRIDFALREYDIYVSSLLSFRPIPKAIERNAAMRN